MKQIWDHFKQSSRLLSEELTNWADQIIRSLPSLILALVVAILGYFLSRYVKKYFLRFLGRVSKNLTINRLLANITTTAFLVLVLFVVLSILDLERALQSMLATAGVAGLILGLALQEPLINFLSGVIMSTRQYFKTGDLVETNGFMGSINSINLRSTVVHTLSGQQVVLPNKMVIQNPLVNYSISGERRVELACGIAYWDDLEKVAKVAVEAIERMVPHNEAKPVEFFFSEFGDSSINFIIRFWLKDTRQQAFLTSRHQAIIALKKAFDENGITIPFPIRTVEMLTPGAKKE